MALTSWHSGEPLHTFHRNANAALTVLTRPHHNAAMAGRWPQPPPLLINCPTCRTQLQLPPNPPSVINCSVCHNNMAVQPPAPAHSSSPAFYGAPPRIQAPSPYGSAPLPQLGPGHGYGSPLYAPGLAPGPQTGGPSLPAARFSPANPSTLPPLGEPSAPPLPTGGYGPPPVQMGRPPLVGSCSQVLHRGFIPAAGLLLRWLNVLNVLNVLRQLAGMTYCSGLAWTAQIVIACFALSTRSVPPSSWLRLALSQPPPSHVFGCCGRAIYCRGGSPQVCR